MSQPAEKALKLDEVRKRMSRYHNNEQAFNGNFSLSVVKMKNFFKTESRLYNCKIRHILSKLEKIEVSKGVQNCVWTNANWLKLQEVFALIIICKLQIIDCIWSKFHSLTSSSLQNYFAFWTSFLIYRFWIASFGIYLNSVLVEMVSLLSLLFSSFIAH